MSWTSSIKTSPRARADRRAFKWAMRRKFRKQFQPARGIEQDNGRGKSGGMIRQSPNKALPQCAGHAPSPADSIPASTKQSEGGSKS